MIYHETFVRMGKLCREWIDDLINSSSCLCSDSEILLLLSNVDDVMISMCAQRESLKCTGLCRWKNQSVPLEVVSFIIDKLDRHESLYGHKLHQSSAAKK